jgi:hypothetical protein
MLEGSNILWRYSCSDIFNSKSCLCGYTVVGEILIDRGSEISAIDDKLEWNWLFGV